MAVAPELHPWNRGFTWRDHEGPFSTISAAQARDYDELGYFVFEDAFDSGELRAIDDAIAPGEALVREFLSGRPDGRFSVAGVDTQTVAPHLVLTSELLRDVCARPPLAGIARDLLGPDVRLYWEQAVYKQPHSAEPVLWHQDNGYTYIEPQAYLTVWVALTDATPENGCVQVLPGVHRTGTVAHRNTPIGFECCRDPDGAVEVPVRAGDAVVFSSLTPHATGHNTTDAVRRAYIVQFAPAGAECLRGDPDAGPPVARDPQDAADRQFPVLVAGARP